MSCPHGRPVVLRYSSGNRESVSSEFDFCRRRALARPSGDSPNERFAKKRQWIFGLANKRSIACGHMRRTARSRWRLAITYQNERLEQEAKDLITDLPGAAGFMCDVSSDEQITRLFEELKSRYGVLHGIVHSVAFAPARN